MPFSNFCQVSSEFRCLKLVFQEVISDITMKMGSGMCVFLENEVGSLSQWDEVCIQVATTQYRGTFM